MSDLFEYGALADTIDVRDIAQNEDNIAILRRLQADDPTFNELWLDSNRDDGHDYCPEGALDVVWLGYFVGSSTHLEELYILSMGDGHHERLELLEPFLDGMTRNKSLRVMTIKGMDLNLPAFRMLGQFFKNNRVLNQLSLDMCYIGLKGSRFISSAVEGHRGKSLECFEVNHCRIVHERHLTDMILALSSQPQLKELELNGNNIGRNGCEAVAALLSITTELRTLDLGNNAIDDEGVDALAPALAGHARLRELRFNENGPVTRAGWKNLSCILEAPDSGLEELFVGNGNVDDEVILRFAGALSRNRALRVLVFYNPLVISAAGWSAFSRVLCDASSVERTFLSNHALECVNHLGRAAGDGEVRYYLELNARRADKRVVAMTKILKCHVDLDMRPFFEWDFKLLPIALDWFDAAGVCPNDFEANIVRRKLSAIYQFIRGMPVLCIESLRA